MFIGGILKLLLHPSGFDGAQRSSRLLEIVQDAFHSVLDLIREILDVFTSAYGVDYLMRNPETDGSWHVHTGAVGFQLYFESGFPNGHDQWISMAATAWSAMALMPAAEVAQVRATR